MKTVKTNLAVSPIRQPLTTASVNNLIQRSGRLTSEVARSLYPNLQTSGINVLYGCIRTGSGFVYNVSAGAVAIWNATNGWFDIYEVPAVNITLTVGQILAARIAETNDPEGAVTMSDGSTANVNVNQYVELYADTTSVLTQYTSWYFVNEEVTHNLSLSNITAVSSGGQTLSTASGTIKYYRTGLGYVIADIDLTFTLSSSFPSVNLTVNFNSLPIGIQSDPKLPIYVSYGGGNGTPNVGIISKGTSVVLQAQVITSSDVATTQGSIRAQLIFKS